jgi:deoxyribodipyrimidine photo-lyase
VTGSSPRIRRAVVLFSRDLRLHDNPVLDLACHWAAEVIPVFVFDPALRPAAPNRVGFLLDCLTDLRAGLRQRGGDLLISRGDPVAEVTGLARSHHAQGIILAADVSRYAQRRYQRLAAACQQYRLALREADALTVVPPGVIAPSGGDHYRVFTPYWRAWSTWRWRPPRPAPHHVPVPPGADAGPLPRHEDLIRTPSVASLPRGGETAARRRMDRWLDDGLGGYPDRRDDLADAATSRLSADLHFGTISPLELAVAASSLPGGDAYVRQLCWRDFFTQVTASFPDIAACDYRPRPDHWRDDPQSYQAWCAGQTGIPIIDAGMRQLAAEGFMPNRARMLAAYVLTKQLRIHWTAGARHFFAWLVDGDIASNAGNWQWIAGTGNDTRPGRRFNLLRQARRFDPAGDYVRRYVPELAAVPGPQVHQPWQLTGVRYPKPMATAPPHIEI